MGRNLEEPRQKYPRIESKVWLVDCVPLFCMHRRYPLIWKLGASLIGGVNTARYTLSAYSPKAPLRPVHHGLGDENYPSFQLSSSKEFVFHNRVMIFLTLLHSIVIFSYLQHHDTQFVMQNNNRKEKLKYVCLKDSVCLCSPPPSPSPSSFSAHVTYELTLTKSYFPSPQYIVYGSLLLSSSSQEKSSKGRS